MLNFLKGLLGNDTNVNLREAVENGALLVDVRTPDEFRAGHIKGAINIPLGTISSNANRLQKHGGTIVAYCRSGQRSRMAVGEMRALGLDAINGGGLDDLSRQLNTR